MSIPVTGTASGRSRHAHARTRTHTGDVTNRHREGAECKDSHQADQTVKHTHTHTHTQRARERERGGGGDAVPHWGAPTCQPQGACRRPPTWGAVVGGVIPSGLNRRGMMAEALLFVSSER